MCRSIRQFIVAIGIRLNMFSFFFLCFVIILELLTCSSVGLCASNDSHCLLWQWKEMVLPSKKLCAFTICANLCFSGKIRHRYSFMFLLLLLFWFSFNLFCCLFAWIPAVNFSDIFMYYQINKNWTDEN